jgi:hypothetical protein
MVKATTKLSLNSFGASLFSDAYIFEAFTIGNCFPYARKSAKTPNKSGYYLIGIATP